MAENQIEFLITANKSQFQASLAEVMTVTRETTTQIGNLWTHTSETITTSFQQTIAQTQQTSQAAVAATGQVTEAVQAQADKASEAIKDHSEKAKASLEKLSGLLGVEIPKQLEDVMAKSKLLGPVLEAAFGPISLLALIPQIIEVTKKVTQFISDTFIYTDKMKKQDEELKALNQQFVAVLERRQKAEEDLFRLTHTGAEIAQRDLKKQQDAQDAATAAVKKQADALHAAQEEVKKLEKAQQEAADAQDTDAFEEKSRQLEETKEKVQQLANAWSLLVKAEVAAKAETQVAQVKADQEAEREAEKKRQEAERQKAEAERRHQEAVARHQAAVRKNLEVLREGLQQQKDALDAFHTMSKKAEADYWQAQVDQGKVAAENMKEVQRMILEARKAENLDAVQHELQALRDQAAATKAGSQERIDAEQRVLELIRTKYGAESDEFKKQQERVSAALREAEEKRAKDQQKLSEEEIAHEEKMGLAEVEIKRKALEKDVAEHKKNGQAVAEEQKRLLDEELQIRKTALLKQLELMKLNPNTSPEALKKLQDQILELDKTFEAKRTGIVAKEVDKRKKLEDSLNHSLQSAFSGTIMGMIKGTQSLSQAMTKMADQMLNTMAKALEDMLTKWIAHHLSELIIHAQTKQAELGTDAATAAEGDAIDRASHAKKDQRTAFSAAKSAFQWATDHDLFPLAPVIAAGAFASVMAIGSAEGGQYLVPGDQLTMLHRNEMVLPAGVADRMRGVIDGGGGGGISVIVNHSVNAVDAASFQQHIRRHGNMIGNEVARVLKKRGFAAK